MAGKFQDWSPGLARAILELRHLHIEISVAASPSLSLPLPLSPGVATRRGACVMQKDEDDRETGRKRREGG